MQKIIVLGCTGMLGASLLRYYACRENYEVIGISRSQFSGKIIIYSDNLRLISDVDVFDFDTIQGILRGHADATVFNCVGAIKQKSHKISRSAQIYLNALFPHLLAEECTKSNSRMIHFSTDCVFKGSKGDYLESDVADASDLYGKSKILGEIEYDNHLTLRTSIIGHELVGNTSLVDWFLTQSNSIAGFDKAIFSGFPTIYIAEFIENYVLQNRSLVGLMHFSSESISKYELLQLIKDIYGKDIVINKDTDFVIDRSLNSERLRILTNAKTPTWATLIGKMHDEYKLYFEQKQ